METDEKAQEQEKKSIIILNPLWSIRQRLSLVLLIGIIGSLFIAAFALVTMKPRYSAEGLINFNPYLPKILYKSEDSDYIHSFEDWVRTQVNIIKSLPVIERAIVECRGQGFSWILPGESTQSAADRLVARLKINQIRDTQTISISLISSTKTGLSELINAIIKGYIQNTRDKSQEENTTKLNALKREREKIDQELTTGYNDLEAISRTYGAGVTDEKFLYMYLDKLNDLKRSYNKAFLDEATAKNRMAAFGDPVGRPKGRERSEAVKGEAKSLPEVGPGENKPVPARAGEEGKGKGVEKVEVGDIRRVNAAGGDSVVVGLSGPARITSGTLSNPRKFFVHVWNASLPVSGRKEIAVDDGLVNKVSVFQYKPDKVRLLFDMKTPKYRYEASLSENPAALVVAVSSQADGEGAGMKGLVREAALREKEAPVADVRAVPKKDDKMEASRRSEPQAAAKRPPARDHRTVPDGSSQDSLAIFNDPDLARLDMTLRDQMVGLAEDHPKYLYLKEKLSLLYGQAKAAYMAKMKNDYEAAANTKEMLGKEVQRVQNEVVDYNTAVIRVSSKKQEIERLQATLNRINERIDQILVEAATPGRIIVQAWAVPPEKPTVDQRGKIILMGIIGSFCLGALISVGIDVAKNSVQRTMDLERFLGFPLTGFVIDSIHDGIDPHDIYTVYKDRPGSFLFDRYVSIGLKFERERADHGSAVFTFFPVGEGSGATSTALNVLASLDAPRERKLYIDLNVRSPLRLRLAQLKKERGITDWLEGSGDIEDFITRPEGFPCVLLQEGTVKNPLPVVMNLTRLKNGLNELRDRYDYIFVDMPPILVSTDTQGVVRISDVAVVLAEANKTTWPELKKTMAVLEKTGLAVVAVVLDRVRILKSGRLREQMETFYRGRGGLSG